MGGGLPIGATGMSQEVATGLFKLAHSSTFGGNPLACAAANAAIRYLEDFELPQRAHRLGTQFMRQLRAIGSPRIRDVRGLGMMVGVELKQKSGPYILKLMERGVLALAAGPTVIRLPAAPGHRRGRPGSSRRVDGRCTAVAARDAATTPRPRTHLRPVGDKSAPVCRGEHTRVKQEKFTASREQDYLTSMHRINRINRINRTRRFLHQKPARAMIPSGIADARISGHQTLKAKSCIS